MAKKVKYGRLSIVVSLTVLIWVWADLALDDRHPVTTAIIAVAKSTSPDLLVTLGNDQSAIPLEQMVLKGSARRIAEVKRKLDDGSITFQFFLDAELEKMTESRKYALSLQEFLRKSDQIRQLGLTVESCRPEAISVNVVRLVKKPLLVKCVDQDHNPINATARPANIGMFVPPDWQGESLTATVQLTRAEIGQARLAAVEKTPYVVLPGNQTEEASETIKVTVPTQQDPRSNYTITTATLGYTLSENLQGKFKVEVTNLSDVISAIAIRATPEAKREYEENMRYQVILEVDDEDAKSAEPIRKELIYNFPPEYVRSGEIQLNQQPVAARFKLIPLPSPKSP